MSSSFNRRQALAATATLGLSASAFAQADAPVRLVVTFPPGGSTDIAARIIQPELAKRMGRTVVVDNKPGAASQLATDFVAKSAPNGNTLLVSFDTHAINPIVKSKLPYDTFEAARRQPAKFSYASTGVGSMNHLVMEDIKRKAGVYVLHVPYGGVGPAVQAVLGDVLQLTLLSYAALKGQIAAGKIKPLAVTGAKRLPDLPNVPTVAASGFPGFEAYSWIGIFAPAGTPSETLRKLTEDFRATLNSSEVHGKLTAAGFEVMATDGAGVDRHAKAEHDH